MRKSNTTLFDGSAAVLILTVAAGGMDAYTYMCRGNAFAGLQTGNLLQIGMKLASGKFSELPNFIVPVLVFAAGVAAASALGNTRLLSQGVVARRFYAAIEVVLIIAAALIPYGSADVAANLLLSIACAIQLHGFRTINSKPVTTTMSTGNLRGLAESTERFIATREKKYLKNMGYYGTMIVGFVAGAVAVGLLVTFTPVSGLLIPGVVLGAGLLVDLFLMRSREDASV